MANSKWSVTSYYFGTIAWRKPDPKVDYWHYYVLDIIDRKELKNASSCWHDWEWVTPEEFRLYECPPVEEWSYYA